MSHQCKALVIVCMDFRFHSAIRDFLVSLGIKDDYDLVSLAGVTKDLVDNDAAGREIILKQIKTSKQLHGIREVYLIHHMDCGGYGGHAAFADETAEKEKQLADLKTAKQIIEQEVDGDLEVHKVLARIEEKGGKYNIDFEVIQ